MVISSLVLTMFWLYLQVVDVVVVLVVEDPDAVEAAGWGTVVKVVLAQVGRVINQPEKYVDYFFSKYYVDFFLQVTY